MASSKKRTALSITLGPNKRPKLSVPSLENGLVNMKKTPAYLVDAARSNSLNSPLLRLPAEIRQTIWDFSMGGNYILTAKQCALNRYYRLKFPKGFAIVHPQQPEEKLPSAFHLPEVCRQIYSETATLAYKLNIFVINNFHWDGFERNRWIRKRLPAQRNAITAIAPQESVLWEFLDSDMSFLNTFPNLEYIEITPETFCRATKHDEPLVLRGLVKKVLVTREEKQQWLLERIRKLDGDGIEVKFGGEALIFSKIYTDDEMSSEEEDDYDGEDDDHDYID